MRVHLGGVAALAALMADAPRNNHRAVSHDPATTEDPTAVDDGEATCAESGVNVGRPPRREEAAKRSRWSPTVHRGRDLPVPLRRER